MIEANAANFGELQTALLQLNQQRGCLFRGVPRYEYDLRPSVGREANYTPDLQKNSMWLFKAHSAPHCTKTPANEWEWLSLAQHHGLPTALLDWTRNPLVALYFAVHSSLETDGAMYCMTSTPPLLMPDDPRAPHQVHDVTGIFSPHVSPRMAAQSGLFTYHPRPDIAYDGNHVLKYRVPAPAKAEMQHLLEQYGVHAAALFPSLDGVTAYIRWLKGFPP